MWNTSKESLVTLPLATNELSILGDFDQNISWWCIRSVDTIEFTIMSKAATIVNILTLFLQEAEKQTLISQYLKY